ncbi:Pentatricopeptide repeat-containing protein [Thalictrum thalictroides]|uniref:Pentatricopeptide repeat-containing protein n=1 Tax=Thalictrum thalictroides TaxID=46969 RepID=A0A7J6WWS7_THATH|nr:Pentatricopeptide repeat-containing protein [Thalictrum thalictroides]
MQALSVWPLKGDYLAVPNFEFGINSCFSSRIGKHTWDFSKTFNLVFVSNNSRGYRTRSQGFRLRPKFNLQCGSLFISSKLDFVVVCKRKRSAFAVPSAVTWALEEEEIGNELSNEVSTSIDRVLDKSEVDCISNDEGKDGENIVTEGNETCSSEETSTRVDVRALAGNLQFAKNADDVEEILQDMEELPLPVYSSMIRGFGVDKRLESAMALFEWLKIKKITTNGRICPNLFIYNSLLGAMKQCKKFEEVDKVMDDMVEEGVVPNIVTYNTLMAIYLEQGLPNKAIMFLEEIKEKGLSPSPVSYSTALLAYRRMEDGNGALKFFVELRDKYQRGEMENGGEEDWDNEFVKLENFTIRICYQVMKQWLVKGDHHLCTKVLKLLVEMDKARLMLGRAEHERLAWACTLESHYIVAKELYNRIRERESEISLSVCNHVIWLLGKAKKWWAALEIYEELLDKGPEPNNLSYELIVSHFNVLLTAASRRGIWRWGVRLLNRMEEKGLKPRSREWNAVIVACSKASETSAAVQIFRRMVEQGEKPTVLSYGALLSALEKGKLYDEALQVWEHMIKVGIKPNLYAYTIMASIYVGQGRSELVESIITEMVDAKIEPTVVTYNAIISGCAHSGMGSSAFEWFNRMKEKNISPNEITYEMLILALGRDAKPIVAHEMYLRAHNEGLRLSSKAYDAVVYSAKTFGATIDISSLGPRPPEKKKKIKSRKDLSAFCNLADVPRRTVHNRVYVLYDSTEIQAYVTFESSFESGELELVYKASRVQVPKEWKITCARGLSMVQKSTLSSFLHIVGVPELLKNANAIGDEMSQLKEARNFHLALYAQGNQDEPQSKEAGTDNDF